MALYFIFPDFPNFIFPTPEYTFRVFVADPIPEGVSNIQTYNVSMGFDTEIIGAFQATPEAIDEIIARNEMELLGDDQYTSDPPYEYFPNIHWSKEWKRYHRRFSEGHLLVLTIWVSPEKDVVLFRFIDG